MASWLVKKELVFEIVLEIFFYYSGTSLVIMMISAIGSSCFKSDLDCDQILHIQWGSLFPASTSVVDGKIGRFIFCLSTDRIWDYLGSTPEPWYSEPRYSEILDIVNKTQLPSNFTKYHALI